MYTQQFYLYLSLTLTERARERKKDEKKDMARMEVGISSVHWYYNIRGNKKGKGEWRTFFIDFFCV